MPYRDPMREHPFRFLLIAVLLVLGVGAYCLATGDEGGVYDPETSR